MIRAKTINEVLNFEKSELSKKSLNIGIDSMVLNFLKWIRNQEVFERYTDTYLGWLEIGKKDIYDKDIKNGFIKFVETWPRYRQLMRDLDLDINDGEPGATPKLERNMFTDEQAPFGDKYYT